MLLILLYWIVFLINFYEITKQKYSILNPTIEVENEMILKKEVRRIKAFNEFHQFHNENLTYEH